MEGCEVVVLHGVCSGGVCFAVMCVVVLCWWCVLYGKTCDVVV